MSTPVTPRKTARYGWTPDLPDARDHLFSAPQISLAALPPSADLRSTCPPVYNQEQIGSCTANAIGAAFEFETTKQGLPDFMPSRLFIYYNERAMEGSVGTDSGAQIRDGVKSVAKLGVCPETEWPYDGTPANSDGTFPARRPGRREADGHLLQGRAQPPRDHVQPRPAGPGPDEGVPGGGVSVHLRVHGLHEASKAQEMAKTGVLSMPGPDEDVVGGHAVLAVGYDDATQTFLVRNSWGADWGQAGYFTMPYAYFTTRGLSSDFWTIRIVT